MSKKWLKAAARYEAEGSPGFRPRKKKFKPIERIPTLLEFMESFDGGAAKALLAASQQFIVLARTRGRIHVILSHKGLEIRTPKGFTQIGAAKAEEDLMRILKRQRLSQERDNDNAILAFPVRHIRKELDNIANNAP